MNVRARTQLAEGLSHVFQLCDFFFLFLSSLASTIVITEKYDLIFSPLCNWFLARCARDHFTSIARLGANARAEKFQSDEICFNRFCIWCPLAIAIDFLIDKWQQVRVRARDCMLYGTSSMGEQWTLAHGLRNSPQPYTMYHYYLTVSTVKIAHEM